MQDAPERDRASMEDRFGGNRRAVKTEIPLRRDTSTPHGYSDDIDPESHYEQPSRRPRIRFSFHGGLVPKTLWGRIAMGSGVLLLCGACFTAALAVRSYLLHDEHFMVSDTQSIQIAGNSLMTRAQLLSVFGEDVERNIFNIPLSQRRSELERLPWVQQATVMRLLPNRVRVAIVERTPVAFVRQGSEIGLVDANGVLLNMPGPDRSGASADDTSVTVARNTPHYSFPVLTGISAADPLSVRTARMKIYLGFVTALDAQGEKISRRLSEVDVSNPEDVKAILSDAATDGAASGSNILVHFGDGKYLERYRQYEQHLTEWRTQYPRLASVDLRYAQQVVLEMQPGATTTPVSEVAATEGASTTTAEPATADSAKPVASKTVPVVKAHTVASKPKSPVAAKKIAGKPAVLAAAMQGDAR